MSNLSRPKPTTSTIHEKKNLDQRLSRLIQKARQIRIDIIRMTYEAGPARKGHPGGALSITDIVAALFFDILRINPSDPNWPDRDRFILSKGHACPALYSALANRGYFDKEEFKSFRKIDGMLQGHPDMKSTPGVDITTGSLGHGLSAGVGMALAAKIDKRDYNVFVLLGDGECQEGLVWEAAMAAPKFLLDNLIAIVDVNRLQSCDWVDEIIPLEPLTAKWSAFGWNVIETDGHNMKELVSSLELAVSHEGQPTVIIAQTVKGKGVSFMEDDNIWHQKAPDKEQFDKAMAELQEQSGKDV